MGERIRERSNEVINNYWMSDLVLIHKIILNDIIVEYRKNGMPILGFIREMNHLSYIVGNLTIILRWFDLRKYNYKENVKYRKNYYLNYFMPYFYIGVIKGLMIIILNKATKYNSI